MNYRLIIVLYYILITSINSSLAEVTGTPRIIDGDTIVISGDRIRLHGIDAPENNQTCINSNNKPWNCGRQSTLFLHNLINGKAIICKGKTRDRYKRLIGVCYLDATNLNAEMVRNGWALAYRKYSTDYIQSEDIAKSNKSGMWSGEFINPWDWRKRKRLKNEGAKSCCKICKKGKACGNSCIAVSYTCREGLGCACNAK